MEHHSQQTSRQKPIYITVAVIHGNVCDLSTKADEDPKVNVCTSATVNQSSLFSQQGTSIASRSDSASSDPHEVGELGRKCGSERAT